MEDENLPIEGLSAETSSQSDDRVEALMTEYQIQLEKALEAQTLLSEQYKKRGDLLDEIVVELKKRIKSQAEEIKIKDKIISNLTKKAKR